MQAILLVGGLGTRLRPLTDDVPKPLLPICDTPMIEIQLGRLRDAGVERIVLAVAHRADDFVTALDDGSRLGVELQYSVEPAPLGTGGAVRLAYDKCEPDEPVVILNGDLLGDLDLRCLLEEHERTSADVTIHADFVEDVRPFGALSVDAAGRLLAFQEKDGTEARAGLVNAGTYVWSPRVIERIPSGRVCSIEKESFPSLIAAGSDVRCVRIPSYWADAGTRESFLRVNADVVGGVLRIPGLDLVPGRARWAAHSADLAPDATVKGRSVVSALCRVEEGAQVQGSVLLRGASVGAGARLSGVIVGPGGVVPSGATVTDQIVPGRPGMWVWRGAGQ